MKGNIYFSWTKQKVQLFNKHKNTISVQNSTLNNE